MKIRYLLPLLFSFALGASAAQPKEYQVTGPIVALTDDVITVDKSGEKWEIGRSAATKVTGDRKSTRLNSSHVSESRMPSSA